MKIKVLIVNVCVVVSGGFSACTQGVMEEVSMLADRNVNFNFDIVQTRTITDASNATAFVANDEVGIFGVANGSEAQLVADNLRYQYSGSEWNGEALTKPQNETMFYAYYPYDKSINDISFSFSVNENQEQGYNSSDLLLAAGSLDVANPQTVNFSFQHVLSLVEVTVSGLATDEKVTGVQMRALKTATVDLPAGTVTADVSERPVMITMQAIGGNKYRTVVPAQTLKANVTRFVVTTTHTVYQYVGQTDATLAVNGIQCFNVVLQNTLPVPETIYADLADLTQENIRVVGDIGDYYPSGTDDAKVPWANEWFDYIAGSSTDNRKVTIESGVLSVVTGDNNTTWYKDCVGMTANGAPNDVYKLTFKAKNTTVEEGKGRLKVYVYSRNIGSNRIFQIKKDDEVYYSSSVDCNLSEVDQEYNLVVDFTKVYGGVGNADFVDDTSVLLSKSRERYSVIFCCYGTANARIDISEVKLEKRE